MSKRNPIRLGLLTASRRSARGETEKEALEAAYKQFDAKSELERSASTCMASKRPACYAAARRAYSAPFVRWIGWASTSLPASSTTAM
jgi:hypothetical protein